MQGEENCYIKLSLSSAQRDYRNGQPENRPGPRIQKLDIRNKNLRDQMKNLTQSSRKKNNREEKRRNNPMSKQRELQGEVPERDKKMNPQRNDSIKLNFPGQECKH